MRKGWEVKKLSEVCVVTAGQSPKGKYYNDLGLGLPFYQGKKEFSERYICAPTVWTSKTTKIAEKNDILMSVRAPVGPVNIATERVCIGRGLASIRATNAIMKDYLFYYLQLKEDEIQGNTGAVFNSINKTQIENIAIPLPSAEEQQHIVSILNEVLTAIAKAKENTEKNLQNAKELFDSYLHTVFSNLGEDWEEKRLGEVFEIKPPKKRRK